MNHIEELFKNDPPYVYLTDAPINQIENAVSGQDLRDLICIADEELYPDDLLMLEGTVIENTGLFLNAFFATEDGRFEYCFQCGNNRVGETVSTVIKIINKGLVNPYEANFLRNNQMLTNYNEVLNAQYLAIYKDKKWLVFDKKDRETKLDCESQEVLSRATEFILSS